MEAVAKTKYLKGSPRKARLVIDLIRGVRVSRALSILKFTDKRAADPIAQCLNSAIANATFKAEKENIAIDPDDLWIKLCFVDMGPHKHRSRMRPAPQGRAYREQRHYCHITIHVTSEEKPKTEKELAIEASMANRPVGKKLAAKAAGKDAKKAKTEEGRDQKSQWPKRSWQADRLKKRSRRPRSKRLETAGVPKKRRMSKTQQLVETVEETVEEVATEEAAPETSEDAEKQ
ncbi:MAG: 50S ribosomal protein L22 [Chloracidobacterium sp.]|nr:50S ribosomal protein L22 [Chloracidobacterium sp.]